MRNITAKGLIIFTGLFTLSACKSLAPDVQVRAYQQDKQRLDQIVDGTVGNWQNAPQAQANRTKDTRKVYFVEFTKEPPSAPNLDYLVQSDEMQDEIAPEPVRDNRNNFASTRRQPEPRAAESGLRRPKLDIPKFEDEETYRDDSYETKLSFENYKVQKNDTLQKISKKFYNSYSKWKQIYDANRDVISNPDVLQPGTSIKIPVQ
ncbi:MAG: LysM peptidoglycan-binding domain-containing protein [Candidatus Omnitrophica bacterium]|nr:LysM peptidoglycan-binding domain-containing protein [Candidatus Omnitrophota bacterium]